MLLRISVRDKQTRPRFAAPRDNHLAKSHLATFSQASVPAAQTPAEDTPSAATIKPEVLPTSDALAGTVTTRARSGLSRGRGPSSRARGGRRGEVRNGDRAAAPHDDTGKDSDDKPRTFQKPRPSDGGVEAVTVAASTEQRAPAVQDQMQSHDTTQRGGRGQRRPREQPRGQPYQRQDQPARAQQEERLSQASAQPPLTGQEFSSPSQAVRANGQRDRRAPAPLLKARPNLKSSAPSAAKNGWSGGGGSVAQSASPPTAADPPVSTSWADEEPSPRTQPTPPPQQQQQRGGGGISRNRHPSQQKAPQAEGQRIADTRGLRQGQGGYGSAPSHEAGISRGDSQLGSRGTQRHYQGRGNVTSGGGGGGSSGGGGGGVAGAKPRRQAQVSVRGQNGPISGGGFADGPNRSDYGEARSSAPAQGNMRLGNGNGNLGGGGGGASQGAGPRKGRPAPSTRRRNGGAGGSGGSGARVPQQQQQQQGAPQRAS